MAHFSYLKLDRGDVSKRISEIQELIVAFLPQVAQRYSENYILTPDSAALITALYFHKLDKDVKPFFPKKINRYKIGAITELTVVKLQPFIIEGDSKMQRKVNAEFAMFCSLSIINEGHIIVPDFNHTAAHMHIQEVFDECKRQRLAWLEAKNINTFPILINGLALFTVFELYMQRFQATAS